MMNSQCRSVLTHQKVHRLYQTCFVRVQPMGKVNQRVAELLEMDAAVCLGAGEDNVHVGLGDVAAAEKAMCNL